MNTTEAVNTKVRATTTAPATVTATATGRNSNMTPIQQNLLYDHVASRRHMRTSPNALFQMPSSPNTTPSSTVLNSPDSSNEMDLGYSNTSLMVNAVASLHGQRSNSRSNQVHNARPLFKTLQE